MAQAKRGANCAPVTTYGNRARYAVFTIESFNIGPQLQRFEDLAALARWAVHCRGWADHAAVLQWFRGQWVPL